MMETSTPQSLYQRLRYHEEHAPERVYLRQPRQGKWFEYTWAQVMRQARQIAAFLQSQGLERGSHIAIFSKNCAEWFMADFGILLAGMVSVPLFSNQNQSSIEYVVNHAQIKLIFVGKLDDHLRAFKTLPEAIPTVSFNYHHDLKTQYAWDDIVSCDPLTEIVPPDEDDLYTIIYSSGTSGTPKGAMYTHAAMSNYLALFAVDLCRLVEARHYHLLSYLPLAHVYERSAVQLGSLAIACDVSFVESLDHFAENLRDVKPTIFAAVPRIWDVFKHKIEQKVPARLLRVGLMIPVLRRVLQKKIKTELGLECAQANVSGASHLPAQIIQFFDRLDLPIQEGYGQTENFAYATLSLFKDRKPGFVGTPRLGVELKLSDEHELLMKSPCLMKGYYQDETATGKAFTKDGWLRTGDIAEIDKRQRVRILGRISENFKNLKGEFIAPSPIEKRFLSNRFVEHLCLVGQELPRNVLVVSLTEEARRRTTAEVEQKLQKKLHVVNAGLRSYEKIGHILIVQDSWSTENDLLTPTLKVKRRQIEAKYHDWIHQASEQERMVVWE